MNSSNSQILMFGLIRLAFLILSLDDIRCSAEFNFEVGKRIQERVGSFMEQPMTVVFQIASFRANKGFPNDMKAPDRDAFFRFDDALMEAYPQFEALYYALEDGVFALHGFHVKEANYREPGHSGYAVEDQDMQKYYNACVNKTSGQSATCNMSEGGNFTECVNGCALERCTDEDSQKDCSKIPDEDERLGCEAKIKWCEGYTIKEAPAGSQLGFVPRSRYCIDSFGIPTQTPGKVTKKNTKELGGCFYSDDVTPVERNLLGDYAYCGGGGICNNTFDGAFQSENYDPRWRTWYIITKAMQKPNWSEPYIFFRTQEMGITFSYPIYTMVEDGRNAFAGVIALDYTFSDLTNFLHENYSNSSTIVSIFERDEPHFVVASSTGSKGKKLVLASDEDKACPNPAYYDCKAVRIPALELSQNKNSKDKTVAKAFSRQKSREFPKTELVTSKAEGEDFLYATQTKEYSIPGAGLEWIIMIMTPVETETADTLLPGDALSSVLIAIAIVGFSICAIFCGLLIRSREQREFMCSDWRFMGAFVAACALLNASSLSFLGPNTNALCLTRMWLVHSFFVLALSLLFAKTYRVYKLVGRGCVRCVISHMQTIKMTIPFVLVQVIILLVFTFVDPSKQTQIVESNGSNIEHRYVCAHDTPAYFAVMMILEGGLLLVGCVLAFKTRNLQSEFNESKQIILAMYDTAVVASILLIVSNVVVPYQGQQRILFAVGIFWTTCFACGVFVIPRLMQLRTRQVAGGDTTRVEVSSVISRA